MPTSSVDGSGGDGGEYTFYLPLSSLNLSSTDSTDSTDGADGDTFIWDLLSPILIQTTPLSVATQLPPFPVVMNIPLALST